MKKFIIYQFKRLLGQIKEGEKTPKFEKYERDLEIKYKFESELDANKIEFPPKYYQENNDFFENLQLYEKVMDCIKEKYKPHMLDKKYLHNDELISMEFKRENYCKKYNLTAEELSIINSEVNRYIEEECELARLNFMIRDKNYCLKDIKRAAELEKKYGNEKRAEELEKSIEKIMSSGERITYRDYVKINISTTILFDIKYNKDPRKIILGGKYQIDWHLKLKLLKDRLAFKGVIFDKRFEADQKNEIVIKQTWDDINKEMRKMRSKELKFDKLYEELDAKYPDFSFNEFSDWLNKKYTNPVDLKPGKLKPGQFDKMMRDFYFKEQVPKHQKRMKLEEFSDNAKKMLVTEKLSKDNSEKTHSQDLVHETIRKEEAYGRVRYDKGSR